LQVDDLPQLLPEQRDLGETVPGAGQSFPRSSMSLGNDGYMSRYAADWLHLPQFGWLLTSRGSAMATAETVLVIVVVFSSMVG